MSTQVGEPSNGLTELFTTGGTAAGLYRVMAEGDGAVIWVREGLVSGLARTITGEVVNLGTKVFTSWRFHSRHLSVEVAKAVVNSLYYDMDNPS